MFDVLASAALLVLLPDDFHLVVFLAGVLLDQFCMVGILVAKAAMRLCPFKLTNSFEKR